MICRHPALLAVLTATLILAARPTETRADTLVDYRITNTGAAGSAPVNEIDALVPLGSINDKAVTSPFALLPGSSGFDPSKLLFGVRDYPPGQTPASNQQLGLSFNNGGLSPGGVLAPGGVVNFSLQLASVGQGAPPLPSLQTPGITIAQIPDATSTNTSTTPKPTPKPDTTPTHTVSTTSNGPTSQVPEPMSLVIWSTLAGLGLIRARRFRRA